MIWMSDSEKKQTLKGLDGVSDCRKEYEEADWEEYQIEKQIAEHQARVQAEELEYLEYQLYLQENNLDPEYLDYLASNVNAGIHLTHQRRNKIDPPVCLVSNRFRFLLCP